MDVKENFQNKGMQRNAMVLKSVKLNHEDTWFEIQCFTYLHKCNNNKM